MSKQQFKEEDKYLKKIERQIKWSIGIAFSLIIIVLSIYFINFHGKLHSEQGTWGTFGDFVGGTLNPVLAALAFYWLTSSIRLQLQELRDTRDVLKETSDHQKTIALLEEQNVNTQQKILKLQTESLEKQIQSAKEQQQQISLQNFENIFFELLKTKSEVIQDITYEFNRPTYESQFGKERIKLRGKEAMHKHIKFFKMQYDGTWKEYYESYLVGAFSPYFRVCYQIVRLIENNEALKVSNISNIKEYSDKQKQYFDIFKATLQQAELESLFFNGLSGYNKYKKIIEKYGLFEPLIIDIKKNGLIRNITEYAYMYEESAFCDNEEFYIYFAEVRKIDPTLKIENIDYIINILIDYDIALNYYPDGKTKKIGINVNDFIDFSLSVDKIVENKIEFINQREIDLKKSNNEKFKLETLEVVVGVENHLKLLKDINYINTVYALLKYHIDYKDYCNYLLSK